MRSRSTSLGANRHRLELIRAVACEGELRSAKRHIRQYLRSADAVLEAAEIEAGPDASPETTLRIAAEADPFKPFTNSVGWSFLRKRGPGHRVVCTSVPDELRARWRAIRECLRAVYRPSPAIYDVKRRGRDRLALEIKSAMESGLRWCFIGDIRDCFPSFNPEALYELPLPRTVIHHNLDYRNLNFRFDGYRPPSQHANGAGPTGLRPGYHGTGHRPEQVDGVSVHSTGLPRRNGPRGLLQGSSTSNLVLAWMFNDIGSRLPVDCRAYVFSDNVIVACRSEAECRSLQSLLQEYFGRHRAGPFVLAGVVRNVDAGEVDVLGYEFRAVGGAVALTASGYHINRLHSRLLVASDVDEEAGHWEPEEGVNVLRQFLSGFSALDRQRLFETHLSHMRGHLGRNCLAAERRLAEELGETFGQEYDIGTLRTVAEVLMRLRRPLHKPFQPISR